MTNKTWKKWSDEEMKLLKIHWESSDMKTLLKTFPDRKYSSLMLKATELGVKSKIKRKRKGSLGFLDNLTDSSCYWWGFIMADGHISKKGELIITLNKKDQAHLQKLAKHLNRYLSTKDRFCTLRIQDKSFGEKWLTELKIDGPKTYFPPDLSIFLTKERFISFFIGLVDGDGCIWHTNDWEGNPWPMLRIELHKNWRNLLDLISEKLKEFYDIESTVRVTKRGTAKIDITKKQALKTLKSYVKGEFLERKWSKLDIL